MGIAVVDRLAQLHATVGDDVAYVSRCCVPDGSCRRSRGGQGRRQFRPVLGLATDGHVPRRVQRNPVPRRSCHRSWCVPAGRRMPAGTLSLLRRATHQFFNSHAKALAAASAFCHFFGRMPIAAAVAASASHFCQSSEKSLVVRAIARSPIFEKLSHGQPVRPDSCPAFSDTPCSRDHAAS